MARVAPSLVRLVGEVNFRHSNRDKWSDGAIGDDSHATRFSDHNPDESGWVHAVDIDATLKHAMGSGPVGDLLIRVLLHQARAGKISGPAHYFIYRGIIYSSSTFWHPRQYFGSNRHDSHVHISIDRTSSARTFSGLWGVTRAVDMSAIKRDEILNNDDWKVLQRGLNRKLRVNVTVDGTPGRETRDAIKKIQKRLGNKQTGIPGRELVRFVGCIPLD